jgi:hypothetical protein
MAGNRLGVRAKILYESEAAGTLYIMQTDANFVLPKLGVGSAAPVTYSPGDTLPPNVNVCPPPKNFKPRGVHVKSADGKARKFLICTSATAEAYATSSPQTFAIDGENFTSTGRKGEQQSF